MYLPGHLSIGYLLARPLSKRLKVNISLGLIFTASLAPDLDILLDPLGLVHHTYTHSLLFWFTPLAILLLTKRKNAIPVVVAVLQHLLVGDILTGSIPLFFPLNKLEVGIQLGLPSVSDTVIEVTCLTAMILYMWVNGDLKKLVQGLEKREYMGVALLLSIAILSVAYIKPAYQEVYPTLSKGEGKLDYLFPREVREFVERFNLEIVTASHCILFLLMVTCLVSPTKRQSVKHALKTGKPPS